MNIVKQTDSGLKRADNGLVLPLSGQLESSVLAKHKAMVAVELEKLAKKFDRFGWERDRGSVAQDGMITDWIVTLCDFPLDEIQEACRAAVLERPNHMPNEGHIYQQIMSARKAKAAAFIAKNKREEERTFNPVDGPEAEERRRRANEILREFKFRQPENDDEF